MSSTSSSSGRLPGSFRDPSGFLFRREGVLYRQVNSCYRQDFEALMGSGLYDRLTSDGLLIAHQQAAIQPEDPELAYLVLQPEPVAFVSYPYEWCLSQLREAALATLRIQRTALEHGLSLKDASAYNIQFVQGRPRLVDSLSFERYSEGEPWVAYRQFCQHFLAPLAIMAWVDPRLGQLLRVHIDGVPLDLAQRLLPRRTWLRLPLALHIHLHARAQRRYAGVEVRRARARRAMSRQGLLGLLDSLQGAVKRLAWQPANTAWLDYERSHSYSGAAFAAKQQVVERFLDRIRPGSVWDLGANVGSFSRLASQRGVHTVAFDYDFGAVESNYQRCQEERDPWLLPLLLDLANPSPALGWSHQERASLAERGPADAVMALALIHHLRIGNNVPFDGLASFFSSLGRHLIIEFVPKRDAQVQRLLVSRRDIFDDYQQPAFEQAFGERFAIRSQEPIPDSDRTLYLMESKTA